MFIGADHEVTGKLPICGKPAAKDLLLAMEMEQRLNVCGMLICQ